MRNRKTYGASAFNGAVKPAVAQLVLAVSIGLLAACSGAQEGGGGASVAAAIKSKPSSEILWRAEVGFQPIDIKAGDITGDGSPDVVVGYGVAPGPSIVAIDSSGTILWRFETQYGVWNIAIGDIDGDGINDVAGYEAQLPSFLYAIKNDGTLLWKVQLPKTGSGNEVSDHLKIADVTGDGRNEIIVGPPGASAVTILNRDGTTLREYNVPAGAIPGIPFIEVGDVSGDGVNDLFISYGVQCPPCGIRVMDSTGSLLWDVPTAARLGHAAIGDINKDGKLDVVVAEMFGTQILALSHLGGLLWTLPLQSDTSIVTLGDIKGDGKLSVLADSGTKVNLIDTVGKLLWTFETNVNVSRLAFGQLAPGRHREIVVSTVEDNSQGGLLFLNPHAKLQRFLPGELSTTTGNVGFRDFVVSDLDGNGIDEVVAISDDGFAYAVQMR